MSPLQTIHQATCDRCGAFETVESEGIVPEHWSNGRVPPYLLCGECMYQLDLFLGNTKLRKKRQVVEAVPDAAE